MYGCVPRVWVVPAEQEEAVDPLKPELQMVVSELTGLLDLNWVLCKSSEYSWPLSNHSSTES